MPFATPPTETDAQWADQLTRLLQRQGYRPDQITLALSRAHQLCEAKGQRPAEVFGRPEQLAEILGRPQPDGTLPSSLDSLAALTGPVNYTGLYLVFASVVAALGSTFASVHFSTGRGDITVSAGAVFGPLAMLLVVLGMTKMALKSLYRHLLLNTLLFTLLFIVLVIGSVFWRTPLFSLSWQTLGILSGLTAALCTVGFIRSGLDKRGENADHSETMLVYSLMPAVLCGLPWAYALFG